MQSGNTPKVEDYYKDLQAPTAEELSFQLEQLVQQGVLTPEQAQASLLDGSAMSGVSTDPALATAQMDALTSLQDISGNGGLTAADKFKLSQIQQDESTQSRGAREAIMSNMAARGAGGSGASMLAQLQNAQDSASRQSNRDLGVAAMAQERALQALMQSGSLAGQMQQTQFGQKAQVADAQDNIARFNAQNSQAVNMQNVQARNAAQAANLQAKQSIADQNVQARNAQAAQAAGIKQQQFGNELAKRGGRAGVAQYNSGVDGRNSQNRANAMNQNIGMGMQAAAMMSDERAKTDIEPFSASDFLDQLVPKKYNYKKAKHGTGPQAGVMAQDLEKSELGAQLVEDTPEGKVVDYSKAGPLMLASLAELNERLRKIE